MLFVVEGGSWLPVVMGDEWITLKNRAWDDVIACWSVVMLAMQTWIRRSNAALLLLRCSAVAVGSCYEQCLSSTLRMDAS